MAGCCQDVTCCSQHCKRHADDSRPQFAHALICGRVASHARPAGRQQAVGVQPIALCICHHGIHGRSAKIEGPGAGVGRRRWQVVQHPQLAGPAQLPQHVHAAVYEGGRSGRQQAASTVCAWQDAACAWQLPASLMVDQAISYCSVADTVYMHSCSRSGSANDSTAAVPLQREKMNRRLLFGSAPALNHGQRYDGFKQEKDSHPAALACCVSQSRAAVCTGCA